MAGRIETLLSAERRLLQDVSHELRSPLTRLDVAVDLASTSDDPGEYPGTDQARHRPAVTVLVNELLQLTRAEGDPSAHNLEALRWTSCWMVWSTIVKWRPERRAVRWNANEGRALR